MGLAAFNRMRREQAAKAAAAKKPGARKPAAKKPGAKDAAPAVAPASPATSAAPADNEE